MMLLRVGLLLLPALPVPVCAQQTVTPWSGILFGRPVTCQPASVLAGCAALDCVAGVGLWCRGTPRHSVSLTVRSVDVLGTLGVEGRVCQHGPRRVLLKTRRAHGGCCLVTGTASGDVTAAGSPRGSFLPLVGTVTHVQAGASCRHKIWPTTAIDLTAGP